MPLHPPYTLPTKSEDQPTLPGPSRPASSPPPHTPYQLDHVTPLDNGFHNQRPTPTWVGMEKPIPDESSKCIYNSARQFIDLAMTDRRTKPFVSGLRHALATRKDIAFDLTNQLRVMAAELKTECAGTSQLDVAIFLETYSQYISAVAIHQAGDSSTFHKPSAEDSPSYPDKRSETNVPGYRPPSMVPLFEGQPSGIMSKPQQTTFEKPHQCDQCPTAFMRKHDLIRHRRIHWVVKPFVCDGCNKAFSRKDALKVGASAGLTSTQVLLWLLS